MSNIYAETEKCFMKLEGCDSFPAYEIEFKSASLERADCIGFEAAASTKYDCQTGKHTLVISDNLPQYRYLLIHEFTHILDDERYVNGDKIKYVGLRGYSEYHASQNELMFLLGLRKNNENSFSMYTQIETLGGKMSVAEYVELKRKHAEKLFSSDMFLKNIDVLISALGVLFNYWGLRSICKMYATDYEEIIDNAAFLLHLSSREFAAFNHMMQGWLDENTINTIINGYANVTNRLLKSLKP